MIDRVPQLKYIIENHPDNCVSTTTTGIPFIPRICADLGVSKQTLYQWVNGKMKPRKKHLHTIIGVAKKYLAEIDAYNKSAPETLTKE